MTRQQIGANMYLTYVPSEKFKTSFLSAQLAVPLRRETAAPNALLVNVLSRGTARFPDMTSLGRELDMLYGARLEPTVRKKGEIQLLGFAASCIDDRYLPSGERLLEPLTDLLGEMLLSPALQDGHLNAGYIASERENLADLIRSTVNDKRSYASRRLIEEMCAGEPFGIGRMGAAQDVEAVTPEALEAHYQSILPRARLELFYCGSAPEERVKGAFVQAFSTLPREGEIRLEPALRLPDRPEHRVVTEEMDVTQGKLCIGCRTECADRPANMIMNAMFGGTSSSKLFLNVREKLSLCYYADSTYYWTKGLITISSGIEPRDYDRAMEEILAQLEDLKNGVWADWEFEAARTSIRCALRSVEDSAASLEDFLIGCGVLKDAGTLEELKEGILPVTRERVMAAAAAVQPDTVYFLRGREAQA